MFRHQVQFYDSDAFLAKTVFEFVGAAYQAEEGAVVIATREHLDLLQPLVNGQPWATEQSERGHFVFFEAGEILATFMVDGWPDEHRFMEVVGDLVSQVSDDGRRHVSAFGEMVAVLYAEGNAEAAVRLEQLWEKLAQQHRFSLLCAYPLNAFPDASHRHAFECICTAHSQVKPIERLLGMETEPEILHRHIALLQQQANSLENELRHRDGYERALKSQEARIASMTLAQTELENLARLDPLTGLANRRTFTDRLEHAVEHAARTGGRLALIYVDLDEFKALNDRHGHSAGDELLKQIGTRLRRCVRAEDTACRWGGDEFAVISEDTDRPQAGVQMQRIAAVFADPFIVGDLSIDVSASVGLSICPDDSADAEALVRNADAAMYRAKDLGRLHRTGRTIRNGQPPDSQRLRSESPPGAESDPALLTVEAAAGMMQLSRPHVLKLIVEERFNNVLGRDGGILLIPQSEVCRVWSQISGYQGPVTDELTCFRPNQGG